MAGMSGARGAMVKDECGKSDTPVWEVLCRARLLSLDLRMSVARISKAAQNWMTFPDLTA